MTDRIEEGGVDAGTGGTEEELEQEIEREVESSQVVPGANALLQRNFNRLPDWVRVLSGAALASAGGFVCHLLHVPLPWLLGALFCSALMSMTAFSLPVPAFVRQFGQSAAGFAVGLFFTPEVGRQLLDLGGVIIVAGIASILVSICLSIPLAKFGGCDRRSAFFSVMPGGLAEMAGLAHQFNANITVVSVAQSLRVVVIVLTVPAAITLYMHHATDQTVMHPPEMSTWLLGLGLLLSSVSSQIMNRLRIFNAFLLGGLIVGAIFGLAADEAIAAPPYARAIAQIAIGLALGARFHWLTLCRFGPRFVPATIAATVLLILANIGIAWTASGYVDFPTAILAASPGGVAEMSLTAEALGLAPPIVAAWHFVRILLVAILTAPLFRFLERRT